MLHSAQQKFDCAFCGTTVTYFIYRFAILQQCSQHLSRI